MSTSRKILGYKPKEYEARAFKLWMKWCESHCRHYFPGSDQYVLNRTDWQMLLANAPLNRWFMIEHEKCEQEFLMLMGRYIESESVSTIDARLCYEKVMLRLFEAFPKVLITEAKKRQFQTKRSGIPILTFNSN